MRLYTLFGNTMRDDDAGELLTVFEREVCEVEAKLAFADKRDYMRKAGFHVTEFKDQCTNLPIMIVRSPITGLYEAKYWVAEVA